MDYFTLIIISVLLLSILEKLFSEEIYYSKIDILNYLNDLDTNEFLNFDMTNNRTISNNEDYFIFNKLNAKNDDGNNKSNCMSKYYSDYYISNSAYNDLLELNLKLEADKNFLITSKTNFCLDYFQGVKCIKLNKTKYEVIKLKIVPYLQGEYKIIKTKNNKYINHMSKYLNLENVIFIVSNDLLDFDNNENRQLFIDTLKQCNINLVFYVGNSFSNNLKNYIEEEEIYLVDFCNWETYERLESLFTNKYSYSKTKSIKFNMTYYSKENSKKDILLYYNEKELLIFIEDIKTKIVTDYSTNITNKQASEYSLLYNSHSKENGKLKICNYRHINDRSNKISDSTIKKFEINDIILNLKNKIKDIERDLLSKSNDISYEAIINFLNNCLLESLQGIRSILSFDINKSTTDKLFLLLSAKEIDELLIFTKILIKKFYI